MLSDEDKKRLLDKAEKCMETVEDSLKSITAYVTLITLGVGVVVFVTLHNFIRAILP